MSEVEAAPLKVAEAGEIAHNRALKSNQEHVRRGREGLSDYDERLGVAMMQYR
jgi:hypothetical protein